MIGTKRKSGTRHFKSIVKPNAPRPNLQTSWLNTFVETEVETLSNSQDSTTQRDIYGENVFFLKHSEDFGRQVASSQVAIAPNLVDKQFPDDIPSNQIEAYRWEHPLLTRTTQSPKIKLAGHDMFELAGFYFDSFLPFFTNQPEGSLQCDVSIEFSSRMKQKLGLSYLFDRIIRLNRSYFCKNPWLLPYTLFHEMTHMWLYDCCLDPSHTARFYKKMEEFSVVGLPVDPQVHIHSRTVREAEYVYSCPNCQNRWYLKEELCYPIYCGFCHDRNGIEYYAILKKKPAGF
ncbi:MAG: SprT-like domain-containing protein [Bdellovibrionota bacterium]